MWTTFIALSLIFFFSIWQNYGMVWVGRHLKDYLVPTLCLGQGHLYPGSGQERVNFCISDDQDLKVILHLLTSFSGNGTQASFQAGAVWERSGIFCYWGVPQSWAVTFPFLYPLSSQNCGCHCPFSYFIAISSKLFFTFCASKSLCNGRGEGSEWVAHGLEWFQWEH